MGLLPEADITEVFWWDTGEHGGDFNEFALWFEQGLGGIGEDDELG